MYPCWIGYNQSRRSDNRRHYRQTRRYRPPLNLRPPRRFGTTRRDTRDRWIA